MAVPVPASAAGADAVILVGGQGRRLRPLTLSAPKPMLPTAGVPFLLHPLSRMRDAGMTHVILSTSYRSEVFESYFGDGSAFGVELEYVVESEPLGTGGGIRNIADRLRADTVLIFNGDILSGVDLGALVATHHDREADVTLYLTEVPDARRFGSVPTAPDGRVVEFLEKTPEPVTHQINAGTYVFTRAMIDDIPAGRPVSVEREIFPNLLKTGARVYGHLDLGYWREMGTPADFVSGSADLVRGLAPSGALPGATGEALVLGGAEVAYRARVSGGSTIGAGCVVGADAVVEGCVVFDGARIEPGAVLRRSVIGRDATVGTGAVVEDAVIGDGARIGAGNELRAGLRVWPGATIAPDTVRFSAPA
jgi:mannose-1-phosphate guanylyltransferase